MPRLGRVCYAVGDAVIAIRNVAVLNFLLFFYTNVVLMDAWLAGIALAIGRVWDGLNDPLVGYLSDRTSSRLGRRRPYILGSSVPLALAFYLLFSPPAGLGALGAFAFLTVSYMALDAFFTLYATPYLALGAELTRDYHERTRLVALRALFHTAGLVLAVSCLGWAAGGANPAVEPDVAASVRAAASQEWMRGAFASAAAFLAIVMAASGVVTFLGCREIPAERPKERVSLGAFVADLRATLRNRPFRVVLATFAVMMFGGSVNQSLAVYVFRDSLGVRDELPTAMTLYLVGTIASLAFWTVLARRLGKNRAFEVCILWSVAVLGSFPILGPETPRALFFVFMVVAGFGAGGYLIPTSIAADVVDHDELLTGVRREGAFFGLWTLTLKVTAGLAIAFVGVSLDLLGYVPNQPNSDATLFGIRMLYGPVPAVFLFVSLLIFRRFPLTRESHAEIHRELEARRVAAL